MKEITSFASFEEASKLDVVYGKVTICEEVPKSDRMLKLTIDFGKDYGTKTILSAIKQEVDWENIAGKHSFFILNFEPRKMMGIISEGMIVPFTKDGKILFITNDEISVGTKIF